MAGPSTHDRPDQRSEANFPSLEHPQFPRVFGSKSRFEIDMIYRFEIEVRNRYDILVRNRYDIYVYELNVYNTRACVTIRI